MCPKKSVFHSFVTCTASCPLKTFFAPPLHSSVPPKHTKSSQENCMFKKNILCGSHHRKKEQGFLSCFRMKRKKYINMGIPTLGFFSPLTFIALSDLLSRKIDTFSCCFMTLIRFSLSQLVYWSTNSWPISLRFNVSGWPLYVGGDLPGLPLDWCYFTDASYV